MYGLSRGQYYWFQQEVSLHKHPKSQAFTSREITYPVVLFIHKYKSTVSYRLIKVYYWCLPLKAIRWKKYLGRVKSKEKVKLNSFNNSYTTQGHTPYLSFDVLSQTRGKSPWRRTRGVWAPKLSKRCKVCLRILVAQPYTFQRVEKRILKRGKRGIFLFLSLFSFCKSKRKRLFPFRKGLQ